jgi:hypothetical protein
MGMNSYAAPAVSRNQTANTKVAASPSAGKGMALPPASDKTMKSGASPTKSIAGFGGSTPSIGRMPEETYNNLKPSPNAVTGFSGSGVIDGKCA